MNLIGNAARFFGRLHLGLRGQILLLGVAGVLVVGAIYLAGLQVEERSQREAERFAALEGLTAKVSENLLQARETATQFMQKPTDKKVASHDETVKTAIGRLGEIEAIAQTLPEGDPLRQALTFRPVIGSYTTRFNNVVSAQKLIGFNENDGLQGKLRAAVHSVETKLKTFDQPRLAVLMLMMRRHEKDFMLRGDEKYGDELTKRAGEFKTELSKAELPDEARAEILKLMETYKTSFLAYMAGQSTLIEETTDLAQIYDRLRPALNAVRKAADERLVAVKAELEQVRWYVFCVDRHHDCDRDRRRTVVRPVDVRAADQDGRGHGISGAWRSRSRGAEGRSPRRDRKNLAGACDLPRQAPREQEACRRPGAGEAGGRDRAQEGDARNG